LQLELRKFKKGLSAPQTPDTAGNHQHRKEPWCDSCRATSHTWLHWFPGCAYPPLSPREIQKQQPDHSHSMHRHSLLKVIKFYLHCNSVLVLAVCVHAHAHAHAIKVDPDRPNAIMSSIHQTSACCHPDPANRRPGITLLLVMHCKHVSRSPPPTPCKW
jgi:hypothetical protein